MFTIAIAPFTHSQTQTQKVMLLVLLATLPGLLTQMWFFGWGTLIQVVLAIIVALLCEALVLKLRQRAITPTLLDGSAMLTAVLLGLSLPPLLPWWMLLIGVTFAIIVGKHLYGGLGHNLFNPAMVGYVLLLISFPVQMISWLPPQSLLLNPLSFLETLSLIFGYTTDASSTIALLRDSIDGTTMATPLDALKTGLTQQIDLPSLLSEPHFHRWGAIGWSEVNIAYLMGGLFLLQQRVIQWHIPAAILGVLAMSAALGYFFDPAFNAPPLFHLFSGATMLGAFFIATDPVSAATSPRGRLIYGLLIGLIVFIIRRFGNYPDAFAFAILLANLTVPLLDKLSRPKTYGAH